MLLDLKSSLRSLRRRPALTITAILTLTLGIGTATAMFTLVSAVLLRPLPYATPDRLVAIWPNKGLANREIDYLRSHTRTMDEVAGFSPGWLMALTDVAVPRQLSAARLTGNMFRIIGVKPMLGTTFGMESEAPGSAPVVVLSHDLWRSTFRGDSGIVGRSIRLNGTSYMVAGVMPRRFQLFDWQSDLWYPLTMSQTEQTWTGAIGMAYGRLRPAQSATLASAEMKSLATAMQSEFHLAPDWAVGARVDGLLGAVVGSASRMIWLLFGGVVFLLLIATANVTNLLLVRAAERRQELSLRLALGASSSRIARLLFSESLLLSAIGGVCGIAMAFVIARFLPALLPRDLPRIGEVSISPAVLGFAVFATVLPAIVFGFVPLMQTRRSGLAGALRETKGGRAGERARGALISAEVGLALVLLVGTALMGRSLSALLSVDVGLKADHLLTARVQPTGMQSVEETRVFWRQAFARIEELPGVRGAATILHLPASGRSWGANIEVDGRPAPPDAPIPRAAWQAVSAKFFVTADVPVRVGRGIEPTDVTGTPRVIVVNEQFATSFFPNENPLGRRIKAGFATDREFATIVGVVGGVRHDSLNAPPVPEVYVPFEQHSVWATSLVVRYTGDAVALAPAIRDAIWSVRREVPVDEMRTMDAVLSGSLQRPRLVLELLGFFAVAGLILGAVGIYGVTAFGVEQRRRELGSRAALGADAESLVWLVVRGGLRYAVIGVAIGVPVSFALSRAMRGLVFGVTPTDPISFGVGAFALVGVAALASWVPARSASRTQPMEVLRGE